MKHSLRLPTILCALCGSLTPVSHARAQAGFAPCTIPDIPSVDSSWRQVRASGFTFCVPGSWKAKGSGSDSADAKRWEGDGVWLTWDLGRPKTVGARVTTGYSVVVRGTNPPPANPATPRSFPDICPAPTNDTFVADSVAVIVDQSTCRGVWMISAWSTAPEVFVQGEARTDKTARILNAIVVTLHFLPSAH